MWSFGKDVQSRVPILGQGLGVSYCDKGAGKAEAGRRTESGQQGDRVPRRQAANPRC